MLNMFDLTLLFICIDELNFYLMGNSEIMFHYRT